MKIMTKFGRTRVSQSKPRILLVEDNLVNQEVALAMLLSRGYYVNVACNGAEAVAMLEHKNYEVILMDVQMPVMNGYEASLRIREMEKDSGMRRYIIGITASAMEGDREKCLQSGMDEYLTKPLYIKDLMNAIGNVKQNNTSSGREQQHNPALLTRPAEVQMLLDKLGGNNMQVLKCLKIFKEDTPRLFEDLRLGIKDKDVRVSKNSCHGIRGMLFTMEMHKAAESATMMETLLLEKKFEESLVLLPIIENEIDKAVNAIEISVTPE